MTALLISLLVFFVAGITATRLLRRKSPKTVRATRGLTQLASMRWRDFAVLVLHAMQARGYRVLNDDSSLGDGLSADGGDMLLERDGERVLLMCKYGNASVVGAQPILGLGKAAELRGAHGAIVVTPGRFDDEARRVAAQQRVELIDGASLWPEVEPLMGQEVPGGSNQAPADVRKSALAWLAAAALGVLTWAVLQTVPLAVNGPSHQLPAASVETNAASRAEPVATAASNPSPAVIEPNAIPTDPEILARRRTETADAISTLTDVDRAVWSTQSTLVVYLAFEDSDPITRLCPLLERYPELAASRVQLQPPQSSERPVRFKQCRAY